jgi:hypothetical protein
MFAWTHEERIIRTNPALELSLQAGGVGKLRRLRRLRLAGQVVKVRIAEPGSMIAFRASDKHKRPCIQAGTDGVRCAEVSTPPEEFAAASSVGDR